MTQRGRSKGRPRGAAAAPASRPDRPRCPGPAASRAAPPRPDTRPRARTGGCSPPGPTARVPGRAPPGREPLRGAALAVGPPGRRRRGCGAREAPGAAGDGGGAVSPAPRCRPVPCGARRPAAPGRMVRAGPRSRRLRRAPANFAGAATAAGAARGEGPGAGGGGSPAASAPPRRSDPRRPSGHRRRRQGAGRTPRLGCLRCPAPAGDARGGAGRPWRHLRPRPCPELPRAPAGAGGRQVRAAPRSGPRRRRQVGVYRAARRVHGVRARGSWQHPPAARPERAAALGPGRTPPGSEQQHPSARALRTSQPGPRSPGRRARQEPARSRSRPRDPRQAARAPGAGGKSLGAAPDTSPAGRAGWG